MESNHGILNQMWVGKILVIHFSVAGEMGPAVPPSPPKNILPHGKAASCKSPHRRRASTEKQGGIQHPNISFSYLRAKLHKDLHVSSRMDPHLHPGICPGGDSWRLYPCLRREVEGFSPLVWPRAFLGGFVQIIPFFSFKSWFFKPCPHRGGWGGEQEGSLARLRNQRRNRVSAMPRVPFPG